MEGQYCDQCENRCPVGALKCGRGRRLYGAQEGGEPRRDGPHHAMPEGAVGLLMRCGHLLHHGGGAMGPELLRALNEQEQAELERLLGLLLADWERRRPAGHPGHHGG